MDAEDNHETEDNPSSAAQFMELSQSSGILSLPSGNKLAEISFATDISDTDTEGDDNFRSMKMSSSSRNGVLSKHGDTLEPMPTKHLKNQRELSKYPQLSESEIVNLNLHGINVTENKLSTRNPNSLSLDDVKVTLQENGNLLSDRGFLNELLKSIDDKIAEDVPSVNQNFHQTVPPTRDPGPSINLNVYAMHEDPLAMPPQICQEGSDPKEKDFASHKQMLDKVEGQEFNHSSKSQVCNEGEYVNLRAVSAPASGILSLADKNFISSEREWQKIQEKHVKFDHLEVESNSDSESQRSRGKVYKRSEKPDQLLGIQSTRVLRELSNLRWTLNGWQSIETEPPTDHKSSLYFLHQLLNMLQDQQLQKKYADEELIKTKAEFERVSKELYVARSAQDRRETRLRAVDSQLGLIQKEWLEAHNTLKGELHNNSSQVHCLKEERDALQEERVTMKKDMARMMETMTAYQESKFTLEETQSQLAASRKQVTDVVDENSRLNRKLLEQEKTLQELELVKLPHIQKELEGIQKQNIELENRYKQVIREKAHLEDDLRLLHDQYKTVLQKVVEEEEKKENALEEKAKLERELKDLESKMASTKQELHNYYQARVEELVGQKSQSLQDQLNKLETNLKGSLEDQLDAQRKSHHHAVTNIQKNHEQELKKIKVTHTTQITQLQQQVKALQNDNHGLQRQRQGIITAVSSILGPNKENQLPGLTGISNLPDVPWENGQISTSTPIGVGSASPLYEQHGSTNIGMNYPVGHPKDVFIPIESQRSDNFNHPAASVASMAKPVSGGRSALTSRPTSGSSSRLKSSRSCSRPASGKSTRSGVSIPNLGLRRSSSSESDTSVFQEGKQTVRQVVGGSLTTLQETKYLESNEKVKAWHSGSDRGFMPLMDEYAEKNALLLNQTEREYRSLPDLQLKSVRIESYNGKSADDESALKRQLPREYHQNIISGDQQTKHDNRMYSQIPHSPEKTMFGKKIYKASEILQSNDVTDEEGRGPSGPLPSLNQVDQEMVKLLQELKTVRTDSRTSDSEAPTHDTSFDQDPATITLHKLSQVSTLLSQYVAQSPAS